MHVGVFGRKLALGAVLAALLAMPAAAEGPPKMAEIESGGPDLSGTYTVKGKQVDGDIAYEGKVAVVKLGQTYRVAWSMDDHRAVGTGILAAKTFAVTYIAEGLPVPGIALFDLGPSGELIGRFTLLGASVIGLETWTPETH